MSEDQSEERPRMIPQERLKKGLALFNAGGATHLVGDLYSVSTKGGQYKVYVNSGRWSCNCTWGAIYSGGWNQYTPCYHAIAAAAQADIDIPLAPPDPPKVDEDDDPFEGLDAGF